MKTEYVRRVLAAVATSQPDEYSWGFRYQVNGRSVSCHYDYAYPDKDGQRSSRPANKKVSWTATWSHDPLIVSRILVATSRGWPVDAHRHFCSLRAALDYVFMGLLFLPFGDRELTAGFVLTQRQRPGVRFCPAGQDSGCWVTEDLHAVALFLDAIAGRQYLAGDQPAPEMGLLRDWVMDHAGDPHSAW